MSRGVRLACALMALASAGGCAVRPPGTPDVIAGYLAVRVDDEPPRAFSAAFTLTGSPAAGELTLEGPLGTTAARARWAPGMAEIETAEGRSTHADLDALAEQALGERVPMAALFDWLHGRPWAAAPSQPWTDGRVGFDQLGWQVDLADWGQRRVVARRSTAPVVTVRVRLEAAL
jgi:outer membrane lipoprotein LolB